MEKTIKLENDQVVYASDWDDGGIWLGINSRYARMHATMTREQAEKLIDAINIALGRCPKCGSEEWDTVKSYPGVEQFDDYAECSCGHQWNLS